MDADPLETAILHLRAAGRHGDAGSLEQLAQSVRADHSLDEGFKALLLGHLRVLAGFRAAQLEALPRGDYWSRRRAGPKTGRRRAASPSRRSSTRRRMSSCPPRRFSSSPRS